MKALSYLLVLDSSAESREAAYLAWDLAKKTGARVVAQHVINVPAIWRLLSCRKPGFIGSGVYFEASTAIKESMRTIAEALVMSYTVQAEGRNIATETYIDEGDPAVEISIRAQDHNMVIMGYDGSSTDASHMSASGLCEQLAEICASSMLIVNANCADESSKEELISALAADTNSNASRTFSAFAKSLGHSADVKLLNAARSSGNLGSYIRTFAKPALMLWELPALPQALAS